MKRKNPPSYDSDTDEEPVQKKPKLSAEIEDFSPVETIGFVNRQMLPSVFNRLESNANLLELQIDDVFDCSMDDLLLVTRLTNLTSLNLARKNLSGQPFNDWNAFSVLTNLTYFGVPNQYSVDLVTKLHNLRVLKMNELTNCHLLTFIHVITKLTGLEDLHYIHESLREEDTGREIKLDVLEFIQQPEKLTRLSVYKKWKVDMSFEHVTRFTNLRHITWMAGEEICPFPFHKVPSLESATVETISNFVEDFSHNSKLTALRITLKSTINRGFLASFPIGLQVLEIDGMDNPSNGLGFLTKLSRLEILKTLAKVDAKHKIASAATLTRLELYKVPSNDYFNNMTRLENLKLVTCNRNFGYIPTLTSLHLFGKSDRHIDFIASLAQLKSLHFKGPNIDLSLLVNLEELELKDGTTVSSPSSISKLTKLRSLKCPGNETDFHIAPYINAKLLTYLEILTPALPSFWNTLAKMTQLECLVLGNVNNVDGPRRLSSLRHLTYLKITGEADINQIRPLLTNLRHASGKPRNRRHQIQQQGTQYNFDW